MIQWQRREAYIGVTLNIAISLTYIKKLQNAKKNLNYKPKKTLIFFFWPCSSLDAVSRCTAGVFIAAEGGRVPDKIVHESSWAASSEVPRKRGLGRVSAAKLCRLAMRFRAWPPLVRPSGLILLEVVSRLLIFDFRDNLEIKLP